MATVGYTLTSGGATIAAGGELIAGLTYTAASGADGRDAERFTNHGWRHPTDLHRHRPEWCE